jgi:histidine triad (HIT) family protein
MRSCVFCEIAAGRAAAHVVLDEPERLAILDTRPVFPGHVLLLPRRHVDTLADLAAEDVGPFFQTGQRIARAVERGMGADGTFVAINNKVSQSVPHLHLHVVPRRFKDGLRGFFWPRTPYAGNTEAEAVAQAIRAAL